MKVICQTLEVSTVDDLDQRIILPFTRRLSFEYKLGNAYNDVSEDDFAKAVAFSLKVENNPATSFQVLMTK